MGERILVIDAGTTSVRAMLFDAGGALHETFQKPLTQHYPRPGWVEHDAGEILAAALDCAGQAVAAAGGAERIAGIGVTNQRETTVAWDAATGEPLARAIVWQDRRTADACAALRDEGLEPVVQAKTGLLLDPYFSATKMRWLIDHVPEVRAANERGTLRLGTVESWLVWHLTGGAHLTDASNASRTALLPLDGASWDEGLCELFGVPRGALGEVVDCSGRLATTGRFGGTIPICGLAGDQQAAAIGQDCLAPGAVKATYGTGAFILASTGAALPRSGHRLLGTVLFQEGGVRRYALEGSLFVAGSLIQWLRDELGLVTSAEESEALARSVPDSGGVVVVPALAGLGAPYWRPEARGSISGLSFATGKAHIVRAALEAMANQTHHLMRAFAADRAAWTSLAIDGGMAANDWLAQDIADLLDLPVGRPAMVETTALGAAVLAAAGCGLHRNVAEAASAMAGKREQFLPLIDAERREARLAGWRRALSAA